jgi:hypothetical protein
MDRLTELINRRPSRWSNLTIKEFERDITILQESCKHLVIRDEYVTSLQEENEKLQKSKDWYDNKLYQAIDRNQCLSEENERYKKALFALLNLSYESDADLCVDIITDTLSGEELMDFYHDDSIKGEKSFKEMYEESL